MKPFPEEQPMNPIPIDLSVDRRLGELAITRAGASRVFQRHRLDFCCGGHRALAAACADKGLDPDAVLAEIAAEARDVETFDRLDEIGVDALIDHILARYHEPHRAELARLLAMARKVERVHRDKASCPERLAAHLARMQEELELHMQKEERVLFPLIRSGRGSLARMPVQVMEAEHRDHGRNLERLRSLTNDYTAPAEACATWRALFLGLSELENELMLHIHLENNLLFPKALHAEEGR
jgi:regulator of cell morphogenesis and NO signaling